eukprot:scaffold110978_cov17-Tisochrysis_lutea.AAC.1
MRIVSSRAPATVITAGTAVAAGSCEQTGGRLLHLTSLTAFATAAGAIVTTVCGPGSFEPSHGFSLSQGEVLEGFTG